MAYIMPVYLTLLLKAICHVLTQKLKNILKCDNSVETGEKTHIPILMSVFPGVHVRPSTHYIIALHHQICKTAGFVFLSHAKVAKPSSYFTYVQI